MRICDREEQRSENIDRVLNTLITSLKGSKIIPYEVKALQILPMVSNGCYKKYLFERGFR